MGTRQIHFRYVVPKLKSGPDLCLGTGESCGSRSCETLEAVGWRHWRSQRLVGQGPKVPSWRSAVCCTIPSKSLAASLSSRNLSLQSEDPWTPSNHPVLEKIMSPILQMKTARTATTHRVIYYSWLMTKSRLHTGSVLFQSPWSLFVFIINYI